MKPTTRKNNDVFLTHFTEAMGKVKADALTVAKVIAYSNREGRGQAHRYKLLGAIETVFERAEENGVIGKNLVEAMERPSMPSRGSKVSVSPEDHAKILNASTPCFRLFLTMFHETGARPSEVSRLTARDVDFPSGVAIPTKLETSRETGKPRIIVLAPDALAILRTQAEAHPEGSLLRTGRESAWNTSLLHNTTRATNESAGTKVIVYGCRHGFATDALGQGVPDAQVPALLGHSVTTTPHRHYSHLTSRMQVSKDALGRVRWG